ncbi:MAG: RluA family pseudouridine synthase [Acidobacteria bacterium]|nr:RluA family pseudouridine synthase [Acidobacteriota bacterium]
MSDETSTLNFQIEIEDAGKRLDAFLAEKIADWSRSRLKKLIDDGDVLVNESAAKSSHKLRQNDVIEVELTEAPVETFEPENIPLEIIYEDEHLAVVNKKAGMVVHPGAGVKSGTLANAIAYHFNFEQSSIEYQQSYFRVGIVHRLDKNTSGLIVVAKSESVHEAVAEQFRNREVYKNYVALVHGETRENTGKIDAGIGRDKRNPVKMAVQKDGRNALSLWRVRQRFEKFTLLDIEIKTGRTHQIRVHLSFINHPVVGDETYNEGRDKTVANVKIRQAIAELNRPFLHAEKLSFTHPKTKGKMDFYAPLPVVLTDFLQVIKSEM